MTKNFNKFFAFQTFNNFFAKEATMRTTLMTLAAFLCVATTLNCGGENDAKTFTDGQFLVQNQDGTANTTDVVHFTLKCVTGQADDGADQIGTFEKVSENGVALFGTVNGDENLNPGDCQATYSIPEGKERDGDWPQMVNVSDSPSEPDVYVLILKDSNSVVTPDVDLTNVITEGNDAVSDIDGTCAALEQALNAASPDYLVIAAKKAECETAMEAGVNARNNLVNLVAQAQPSNAKLGEAQTLMGTLADKISWANGILSSADALLNAPHGRLVIEVVTPESSGQPVSGATVVVKNSDASRTWNCTSTCTLDVPPGPYQLTASMAGHVSVSPYEPVTVADGDTGNPPAQVFLPATPTDPVANGELIPIPTFYLKVGTSQNMAGLSKYFNDLNSNGLVDSGEAVVIPDAQITLTVKSGSSAAVNGLMITDSAVGNTVFTRCWNTTTCDEFTVIGYITSN